MARLERYLVLAEEAGVIPVIVLTKIDECAVPSDYRQRAEGVRPGVFVELVNALEPSFLEVLLAWCDADGFVRSGGPPSSTR